MTRRRLLAGIGASAFAATSGRISFGTQTNAWPIQPAKLDSLLSVLGEIRSLGFEGFETSFRNLNIPAEQAASVRKQLEETGLKFFGEHIFLTQYDPQTSVAPASQYEAIAERGASLGAQRLILSGAAANGNEDALKRKAEALNHAGAYVKKLGMRLGYHNHDKEFLNSGWEINGLLRQTDPSLVSFVLDAGHAFRAGADIPSFLREHSKRLDGLHLRDFRDNKQVPLGQGNFPLQSVAETLHKLKWTGWVLTEEEREDGSKPGESAVKPALESLRKAFAA